MRNIIPIETNGNGDFNVYSYKSDFITTSEKMNLEYFPIKYFRSLKSIQIYSSNPVIDDYCKMYEPFLYSDCFFIASRLISDFRNSTLELSENSPNMDIFFNQVAEGVQLSKLGYQYSKDIIIFYVKQIFIMLKNGRIVNTDCGKYSLMQDFTDSDLCFCLFESFWQITDWSCLFPSMPAAASKLQNNKLIIINMMLLCKKNIDVTEFSRKLLSEIGFKADDEMLFISFVDFSIFNWFALFGFIKYSSYCCDDAVVVRITPFGRSFLSNLLISEI